MLRSSHTITLGLASLTAIAGFAALNVPAPAEAQVGRQVSWSKDVLPIFQRRCQLCHGVEARGGLKLDSYENTMAGGAKGPAIVKNSPANSLLVQYIEGARQPRMPVGGA